MNRTGSDGWSAYGLLAAGYDCRVRLRQDHDRDKVDTQAGQARSVPHRFFYWCLLSGGLAIVAAIDLDTSSPPAVALDSPWLYRFEVGGAVFVILYALGLLVGFAFFGKALPQVDFPAGGGMQLPAEGDLNRAAKEIDQMVEGEEDRYESLSEALRRLDDRVGKLEDSSE